MKYQGKLIRAKKAERVCYEANIRLKLPVDKWAEYLGSNSVVVDQKLMIDEDDAKEDNVKIQQLLLKNKVVYYLNLDLEPRTITSSMTFSSGNQTSLWNYTSSTYTQIIMPPFISGGLTYTPPKTWVSGYRIFVPAKTEKQLIDKISRAAKYHYML